MNEIHMTIVLVVSVAPIYALGALALYAMEQSLLKAVAWPIVAIYRTFGG